MKYLVSVFVLVATLVVAASAVTKDEICERHPLVDKVLKSYKITNGGVSCFTGDVDCLAVVKEDLSSFYSGEVNPVHSEFKGVFCPRVENHCMAGNPAEIAQFKTKFDEFIASYHTAIQNLFVYDASQDTAVNDIVDSIFNAIKEKSSLIGDALEGVKPDVISALEDAFESLGNEAKKLEEHYGPFLESLTLYNGGLYCFATDADLEKYYTAANDGIKVSTDVFEQMASSYTSFHQNLSPFIDDLRTKLIDLWESITNTGSDFIDGIIDGLFPMKSYLNDNFTADNLFVSFNAGSLQECFFPPEGQEGCIPFVADIHRLIERLKLLFKGKIQEFLDFDPSDVTTEALPTVLNTDDKMSIVFVNEGGYSLLETGSDSPVNDEENEESDENLLFGFKPLYVYVAAGALGFFILSMTALFACRSKKQTNPYMMMGMQQPVYNTQGGYTMQYSL